MLTAYLLIGVICGVIAWTGFVEGGDLDELNNKSERYQKGYKTGLLLAGILWPIAIMLYLVVEYKRRR